MGKLSDIAKRVVGEQTMKLDDIVAQFDGAVTLIGLSYADYKGDHIPVYSFAEGEGRSFFGGCKKLRELAEALMENYGDLKSINDEFKHTGLRVKIFPLGKTSQGKPFRPVSVLGEVKLDVQQEEDVDVDIETGEIGKAPKDLFSEETPF